MNLHPTSDSERTESETETAAPKGNKDQGEVDSSTVTSGVSIPVSDPEQAHEALAGPDPEPMNEDQTGSDSGKLHGLVADQTLALWMKFLATALTQNKQREDYQEKSKVREESDSTIPDSSHQTVTSTPPVIAPFTEVSSSKPSLLVTPPPINTEATTITTSLPEITPFIALQLRVARLEQEMSCSEERPDHTADRFGFNKIPRIYIEKLLLLLPGPVVCQDLESKKVSEGDHRAKKGTR
ncbi:hypothetical protein Tco_1475002 [Tanacetum coccineum]